MARFKLSACIEWLFAEAGPEFPERVRAAAAAGMDAVEFWTWRGRDLAAIAGAASDSGIAVAGICVEPWGSLTDPATVQEFLTGVRDSCDAAAKLGCRTLVSQVGPEHENVPRTEQHSAIVAALAQAEPIVADAGITLVIEPLNTRVDHVGYYLGDTAEGLQIIREVGSPNIKLLYDRYHSMVMDEPIGYGIAEDFDLIHHIHLADAPGRHEPGTGKADWPAELTYFADQDYQGYLGLEFQPTIDTVASLRTLREVIASI